MALPGISQTRPTFQVYHPTRGERAKNICFKIFVVFTVVLAAITAIAGILALLAAKGFFPPSMEQINRLKVLGVLHGSLILASGTALFILGILTWHFHLQQENARPALIRR